MLKTLRLDIIILIILTAAVVIIVLNQTVTVNIFGGGEVPAVQTTEEAPAVDDAEPGEAEPSEDDAAEEAGS
mgnify:CR=1 FL=1